MKKKIMNFCGCEVILEGQDERRLERAEKEIKRIIDKELHIPDEKELQEIVERDLGVKKHWLWGWIKT
jgi:hypothetical protein